jgi:hypothetical protein
MSNLDLKASREQLSCGYVALTFIWNGEWNKNLSEIDTARCQQTLELLREDSKHDRLGENYSDNLNLENMFLYTVLWDEQAELPVQVTGTQLISPTAVRMYSRYYIFKNYRTEGHGNLNTNDKIDDFELLNLHLKISELYFPYVFISRDKGVSAFKRLKRSREDIFHNWHIINEKVQIGWYGNFQGVIVYNITEKHEQEFMLSVAPTYDP